MKSYASILRNHKRPLRFLAGRVLVKSGLCTLLTIPQNGYRLRFYPSNLSEQLWVDRTWREPELRLIRAYLRNGDHVIDVGANVGDTALTAALQVGAEGCVWAIEAHPRTYSFLKGNLALNGAKNIMALNAAAASEPGSLSFSDDRRDDMNRVGGTGIDVEARRLDDLVPHHGPIDLLKIDVEGYELQVLGGAPDILLRTRCVLFEVAESHFQQYGYNLATVLELLATRGFTLLRPIGQTLAVRIGADFATDRVENLVAVRDVDDFASRSGWAIA
ncbi:MAG: FkbM family methyltransferase [Methylocystaceae bacterium]|nr:MAG: FkbM family methyltransferase [Methylocystaceae bacterium]